MVAQPSWVGYSMTSRVVMFITARLARDARRIATWQGEFRFGHIFSTPVLAAILQEINVQLFGGPDIKAEPAVRRHWIPNLRQASWYSLEAMAKFEIGDTPLHGLQFVHV
ncbi:hypothetical protein HIM_02825 [Hirsutella minnesotensis 3608]|nr:hypothetical protein HIM_02825 [Hirsutella minnesotensis 3608]